MTSIGKHQLWTVNSAVESFVEMSPLLEVASPPKKQAWTVNRELARLGHWYSLQEEREREREEGRGGEENVFQLF